MTTTLNPEAPEREPAVTGRAAPPARRRGAGAARADRAARRRLPSGDLGRLAPARAAATTPRARSLPGGSSSLIGIDPVPADPAADPWFHTRPSASAPDDAVAGLGPADPRPRAAPTSAPPPRTWARPWRSAGPPIAAREGVDPAAIPPDALTASASGLDPHISPEYAAQQAPARRPGHRARPEDRVRTLVADATAGRSLGFLGRAAGGRPGARRVPRRGGSGDPLEVRCRMTR